MAKKGTSAGFDQLKLDMKSKQPARFYVFYGEEDYLRMDYIARIKGLLLDDLTADFNFHRLNPETFSIELLANSLESLPMMAERSVILVEDVDLFALDGDSREKLTGLLSDVPDYCCLILSYEEFKPDKRKKNLWDAISRNAVLVDFPYQSETSLINWIGRHFRHEGKEIDNRLCAYLLELCGQSMTRLSGEIGKICAYSGADTIVRADIDAVVEPTLDAVVFQISDALAQREFDRALERLHAVLKMQTDPISIVATIGNQMRRLNAAKILQSEGKNAEDFMRLYGIQFSSLANKTMGQARRLSERFCRQAVLLCCETDLRLKSSYGDGEELAELLILQLAEEARHD